MSNPFIAVQAGVFASVPAHQGEVPMAALICAALAERIADPSANVAVLDKTWWSQAFSSVPLLSVAGTVTGTLANCTSAGIGAVCLGADLAGDVPGGRAALARWIGAIHPQPVLLNSIAATGTGGTIHLSLAFVDVRAGSFARTDALINAGSPVNASNLKTLFGSAQPITNQPYYCSLSGVG